MLQPLLTIARNTLTESIRQPIYLVLLVSVSLMLILGHLWAGYTFEDDTVQAMTTGLSTILIGGLVLAALLASGVLAREIDNKTVLTVISKPIGRPVFVLGKYAGVTAAVTVALWVWSLVFLMLARHKVMSAGSDQIDGPVWVFGFGALAVALLIAVWTNYFYNWVFNSTFVAVIVVTLSLGYLMVLMISKQWQFQSIVTEFDPELAPVTNYGELKKSLVQVIAALLLVAEATWLLCAVAVAASTRLGQVMTLMACAGVFVVGVWSDYLFGRHAEINTAAWLLYHGLPNLQPFFMADALTQRHGVDAGYVGLTTAYVALYALAVLALAVGLFQTRETG